MRESLSIEEPFDQIVEREREPIELMRERGGRVDQMVEREKEPEKSRSNCWREREWIKSLKEEKERFDQIVETEKGRSLREIESQSNRIVESRSESQLNRRRKRESQLN